MDSSQLQNINFGRGPPRPNTVEHRFQYNSHRDWSLRLVAALADVGSTWVKKENIHLTMVDWEKLGELPENLGPFCEAAMTVEGKKVFRILHFLPMIKWNTRKVLKILRLS